MKTIKVYTREILERTGYRSHPYREREQWIIKYGDETVNPDMVDLDRIRKPFKEAFSSRSKKATLEFANSLGRSNDMKALKEMLLFILEKIS